MKKETKVQLIIIVILSIILSILLFVIFKDNNNKNNMFIPMEEETIKETTKDDVDNGDTINEENINLNNYKSNINITKGGEYNISGSFNYSLIINSKEKVILNLNNVTINSEITASIANINTGELVINIPKGTTSTLKDKGSSEYDGCIYSSGKLTIEGNGKLYIYGNQEEGEGIATTDNDITINGGEIYIESADDGLNAGGDNGGTITINDGNIYIKASGDGIDSNKNLIINGGKVYTMGSSIGGDAGIDTDGSFEINGGEVIALGSDMLQNPDKSSKQKYVSFTLNSKINKNSKIILKDTKGNDIISFSADEDFKTLILSNTDLATGTYYLYINDDKTEYSRAID
ncbi:MAG: carbohydrate-binding domain-containing protein [Bacilli bacterium]|nr:carbohydrate-binding domain-containing protein [Bacilli bacterium]